MDTSLLHLAALPDECPVPMLELVWPGPVLSPNVAATAVLPDLATVGLAHAAVQGLPALAAQMRAARVSVAARNVQVYTRQFHQLIVALPGRQAIRVYLLDVTPSVALDPRSHPTQPLEAIGRLAGGVAHHFNTLLTIILGYAELLEDDLAPTHPGLDKVQAIKQAGQRAAILSQELLAFSRRRHLEPQLLQLNTLVRGLITRLRPPLLGPSATVTSRLDPRLGLVEADPVQIEQALMHLVVNACEAMPLGGHLRIETRNIEFDRRDAQRHTGRRPGPYILVAVRDTGRGMDAATQAQMFEPFFTTKPVGQGTGLSLAVVYGTITHSGGHVEATSVPGQGTTVSMYLPRVQPVGQQPAVDSGTLRLPHGTETVVLVEAEPRSRIRARRFLEACGYTVLDAGTGGEALERIAHSGQPVHVLVTDIVLADMRGPRLAAQVSAADAAVICLYMAGPLDGADAALLSDAGALVLQKPLTPAGLVQQIRAVLDSA